MEYGLLATKFKDYGLFVFRILFQGYKIEFILGPL